MLIDGACPLLVGIFYLYKMEIWKDIPGYEGVYQASNIGNIKSLKFGKEKILRQSINRGGYYYLIFCKNRKQKAHSSHRLIALTFIKNNSSKPDINHKDGNKLNNELSNLEWCTKSENTKHAYNIKLKIMTNDIKNKISKTISNSDYVKCPHCDIRSRNISIMKRWHFDKCKNKGYSLK